MILSRFFSAVESFTIFRRHPFPPSWYLLRNPLKTPVLFFFPARLGGRNEVTEPAPSAELHALQKSLKEAFTAHTPSFSDQVVFGCGLGRACLRGSKAKTPPVPSMRSRIGAFDSFLSITGG